MDNSKRMAALQAQGAGAPPAEPPQAPPDAMGGGMGDDSGMPPPEQAIPQIADLLNKLAEGLPDDKKGLIKSAVDQLQAAFPTDSSSSEGGMSAEDNEAYGEPTSVK